MDKREAFEARLSEIEDWIAAKEIEAPAVYTQMRQMINALASQQEAEPVGLGTFYEFTGRFTGATFDEGDMEVLEKYGPPKGVQYHRLYTHPSPTAQDSNRNRVIDECIARINECEQLAPSPEVIRIRLHEAVGALHTLKKEAPTAQDSKGGVPGRMTTREARERLEIPREEDRGHPEAHAIGWNDCRKAMLSAAPSVAEKSQRRLMCRDCADAAGICPNDGTPCDSTGLQRPQPPEEA